LSRQICAKGIFSPNKKGRHISRPLYFTKSKIS
jgi:hypothetical protein